MEYYIPETRTKLSKISKVYIVLGYVFICIGLFLLIGSIFAAIDNKRITFEPIVGLFILPTGLGALFAGYVGEAIDDIRRNTKKDASPKLKY